MAAEDESPERKRLREWTEANPRTELGLIAIAAWCNCTVEQLPPTHRGHTCAATKAAWDRVAKALAEALLQGAPSGET